MNKMIKIGSIFGCLAVSFFAVNTIGAETTDEASSGAVSIETFQLKDGKPVLTTTPTQKGCVYTLLEGTDIAGMMPGDTIKGDGKAWSPTISIFGGMSGFYSVLASRDPSPDPTPIEDGRYCVIDLTNNEVSYLDQVPDGGWTEEYKTTNVVLRCIKAGRFMMGSPTDELGRSTNEDQHAVTLTKDYWIGVFEVTQKQWELVMGSKPSYWKGDARPVTDVSYNAIRGDSEGARWPANDNVDASSFMGVLRSKIPSLKFDLPTEAQWEYACRAGTTTALNSGKNLSDETTCTEMDEVGRYRSNQGDARGGYSAEHTTVGSYKSNAWGLYDMHGNVSEWCLDWYQSALGTDEVSDPVGPSTGETHMVRGGSWYDAAHWCRSARRIDNPTPDKTYNATGFRLVMTPLAEPK